MNAGADPTETIKIGPVLYDALMLVVRHWLILLISFLALAEACLLTLEFVTRCFGAAGTRCLSVDLTMLLGSDMLAVRSTARILADETQALLVFAVAFYFLYSSRRLGFAQSDRLRASAARTLRFVGRIALWWILILSPVYALEFILSKAWTLLPMLSMSLAMRWVIFLARVFVFVLITSYLHAGLALYLPDAAYSRMSSTLRRCWAESRPVRGRLFLIFLLIGTASTALQIGFMMLIYNHATLPILTERVAAWFGMRSDDVMHILPQSAAYMLTAAPGTLLAAAVSLVVYRRLAGDEERITAEVFS
jgi:hypothetical protein